MSIGINNLVKIATKDQSLKGEYTVHIQTQTTNQVQLITNTEQYTFNVIMKVLGTLQHNYPPTFEEELSTLKTLVSDPFTF